MQQYGTASVYGVDGTVTIGNAYVLPDSVENENSAEIDEFMSGLGDLLGFYKTNERVIVDLVLIPKADTLAHAKAGIALPEGPCKVTLADFVDSGEAGSPNRNLNGDYIYKTGARRSIVRGQASFRMQVFRPLNTGLTIDQLVTKINA